MKICRLSKRSIIQKGNQPDADINIYLRDSENKKNSYWWESYIIRYTIGTIIGAICVYILLHIDIINSQGLNIDDELKKFTAERLVLFVSIGFGFCYLSSAPSLVFHTCRNFIDTELTKLTEKTIYKIIFISCCFLPLLQYFCKYTIPTLFLILFILQMYAVYRSYLFCNKKLIVFYEDLKKARDKKIIDSDSYKHLREHGNAYFLVLLEIFFSLLIYFVYNISHNLFHVLIIICLWTMPSAIVYFIGTKIEFDMIKESKK